MGLGRMAKTDVLKRVGGSFAGVAMTQLTLVVVALVSSSTLLSSSHPVWSLAIGLNVSLSIVPEGGSSKSGWWRVLQGSDLGFDSVAALARTGAVSPTFSTSRIQRTRPISAVLQWRHRVHPVDNKPTPFSRRTFTRQHRSSFQPRLFVLVHHPDVLN